MTYIICPHCNFYVEIEQINCAIFRHGVYKKSNKQINPHLDKLSCDELVKLDKIYGCGKPFKLTFDATTNGWIANICDYI